MEQAKEKPRKKKGGPVETMASKADPHQMYQMAIQSPKEEIRLFVKVFTTARHRKPLILREDFCGTAYLCAEWVKGDAERFAYGLDIDPSVIKWGLEHNKVDAGPAGDRMELFVRDVNDVTNTLGKKCDILVAVNYSICYFHSRTKLITYFTNVQKGMKPDGIFVCDLLGGTSSLGELKKEVRVTESLTKIWEQTSFDAYSHRLKGQVSFKFSDGSRMKAAFTYDFRLWMLPEVIEAMYEAGFKDVKVWWADNEDRDDVKSAYEEVTSIEQTESWKVYIIALL